MIRLTAILLILACSGCGTPGSAAFDRRHGPGEELQVIDALVTAVTPGIQRTMTRRRPNPGLCVARTLGASELDFTGRGLEARLLRLLGREGPYASGLRLAAKPALRLGKTDIDRYILNAVDPTRCTEDVRLSLRRVHFYEDKAIVRFEMGGCPISHGYFLLVRPEGEGSWRLLATVAHTGPCPFSLDPPDDPAAWFHARGAL